MKYHQNNPISVTKLGFHINTLYYIVNFKIYFHKNYFQ